MLGYLSRKGRIHVWGTGLLCTLSVGCVSPDPAPESVDDLFKDYWEAMDALDQERLAELAALAPTLVDVAALSDKHVEGVLTPLTEPHQALVDLRAPADDDGTWTLPAIDAASGIMLLNAYSCDPAHLGRLLSYQDQLALYPDYTSYDRSFVGGSRADFLSGATDALEWQVDLAATRAGASYTSFLEGRMVRAELPEAPVEGVNFTGDHYWITRTTIPWPARFKRDNFSFTQDYQLEIYLPIDGQIVHLYAVWREAVLLGLGMDSAASQQLTLGALKSWDDDTEKLCEAGLPAD